MGKSAFLMLAEARLAVLLSAVSLSLSFTAAAEEKPPVEAKPVVIAAGDDWQPIQHVMLPEKGSALDFSFILDAPAGKDGLITIRDGHFEYGDKPGVRARFYGTNFVYGANFPDHETADAFADQLARIGYNSIRFHHFEKTLADKSAADSLTFDQAKLDSLDYFFAACKKRGIYVTIDIYASRVLKPGEIPELSAPPRDTVFKGAVPILDSARKNWEEFASRFLNHVNPYTKMAWKDDPALYLICLINEGNVNQTWSSSPELKSIYMAKFEEWLKTRPEQPKTEEERRVALNYFLTDVQRKWIARGSAFIKGLGCKALITDNNYISMRPQALFRDEMEVVDVHCYYGGGEFTGAWGSSPMKFSPNDQVAYGADMPLKGLVARIFGKPFAMTEFSTIFPNPYRASSGVVFGGFAAFNDIDALYRFDYIGVPSIKPSRIMWYSTAHDPVQLLSDRMGILMFTRADLKPAQVKVPYLVTDDYLKTPKALDWSQWYPDPFAFTGLHSQVGTIVLRDGRNLQTPFSFAATTEKVDESRLNGLKLLAPDISAKTAKLREMGLVPPAGKDSPAQLKIDRKKETMTLIAERSECLVLGKDCKALDGSILHVSNADMHATIALAAIDKEPLQSSKRILILHMTDVANSNMVFHDASMKILDKYGDLPLLARKGSANIEIYGRGLDRAKLYALDMAGRRVENVQFKTTDKGISFLAQTFRPGGPCFAYELLR